VGAQQQREEEAGLSQAWLSQMNLTEFLSPSPNPSFATGLVLPAAPLLHAMGGARHHAQTPPSASAAPATPSPALPPMLELLLVAEWPPAKSGGERQDEGGQGSDDGDDEEEGEEEEEGFVIGKEAAEGRGRRAVVARALIAVAEVLWVAREGGDLPLARFLNWSSSSSSSSPTSSNAVLQLTVLGCGEQQPDASGGGPVQGEAVGGLGLRLSVSGLPLSKQGEAEAALAGGGSGRAVACYVRNTSKPEEAFTWVGQTELQRYASPRTP